MMDLSVTKKEKSTGYIEALCNNLAKKSPNAFNKAVKEMCRKNGEKETSNDQPKNNTDQK